MSATGSIPISYALTPYGEQLFSELMSSPPRFSAHITVPKRREKAALKRFAKILKGTTDPMILDCGEFMIKITSVVVNDRTIWSTP